MKLSKIVFLQGYSTWYKKSLQKTVFNIYQPYILLNNEKKMILNISLCIWLKCPNHSQTQRRYNDAFNSVYGNGIEKEMNPQLMEKWNRTSSFLFVFILIKSLFEVPNVLSCYRFVIRNQIYGKTIKRVQNTVISKKSDYGSKKIGNI